MAENPRDQKVFLGDSELSREANAANIHLLNISICFLMKIQFATYALKQTGVQIKMVFQDITLEEMMAFLSFNISMGIVNSSDIKDFWSANPMLSQPWFPSTMSRDRFQQILYYPSCEWQSK